MDRAFVVVWTLGAPWEDYWAVGVAGVFLTEAEAKDGIDQAKKEGPEPSFYNREYQVMSFPIGVIVDMERIE